MKFVNRINSNSITVTLFTIALVVLAYYSGKVFLLVLFVFVCEVLLSIKLKTRARYLPSCFSRYNMFKVQPGTYRVNVSNKQYNLPNKHSFVSVWDIRPSGYLSDLRQCEVVLLGGSSAFGTGSRGSDYNISSFLNREYGTDVLNLSVPGYNIEQEILTLFQNLDLIKPQKVILFDGANNLAMALPFDYNNKAISEDPCGFYGESGYQEAVARYFGGVDATHYFSPFIKRLLEQDFLLRTTTSLISFTISKIRRIFRYFFNTFSASKSEEHSSKPDFTETMLRSINNYVYWLEILSDVCQRREIEVYIFTQPYYMIGRQAEELKSANFFNVNKQFDDFMLQSYAILDKRLNKLKNIYYCPIYKKMANEDINYFVDAVHLTEDGYRLIAKEIAAVIKP
jgi:hypothetical protein